MKKLSIKKPFSLKRLSIKKSSIKKLSPKSVFKTAVDHILTWDLRKIARNMTIFAVVVGVIGGYLWYSKMYMTTERRFWLAVENSMSTPSVTRTIQDGGTGNLVVQRQRFNFNAQHVSESKVNYAQKSAIAETVVETEGISFPDAQFSRYTQFRTTQKKTDGKQPSLDSILGKWEGTYFTDQEDKNRVKSYMAQQMITLGIFGNFEASFRRNAIGLLKDDFGYKPNFKNAKETEIDGKKVLLVKVNVYLKEFTKVLQDALVTQGYGEYPPLNPDNFTKDDYRLSTFVLDLSSNSIVGIQYGTREEKYSGYGIVKQVDKPAVTYKSGELESIVEEEIAGAL